MNIVDIFRDVVESLTKTIEVNSVDVSGSSYTFNVDNTYWVRPSSQKSLATKVTIDAVEYDVESMVYNQSITVTSLIDLSDTSSLSIAAPVYINGTQLATQSSRRGKNSWTQCPFAWLVEPFVSNEQKDDLTIIKAQPDLTMLFLDNMNAQDWQTGDSYSNVITPMNELADAFYDRLKELRGTFGEVTNWRVVRWAKFGEEGRGGAVQSILNEKTSGVEVRFSIEILKNFNSCN